MIIDFQEYAMKGVKPEIKAGNEPEVASYFLKKYKVVCYLGKLYWFDNGRYMTDDDKLKRVLFDEVGMMKTKYIDEIIKQMRYRSPIIENKTFDIKLQNGIVRERYILRNR